MKWLSPLRWCWVYRAETQMMRSRRSGSCKDCGSISFGVFWKVNWRKPAGKLLFKHQVLTSWSRSDRQTRGNHCEDEWGAFESNFHPHSCSCMRFLEHWTFAKVLYPMIYPRKTLLPCSDAGVTSGIFMRMDGENYWWKLCIYVPNQFEVSKTGADQYQ